MKLETQVTKEDQRIMDKIKDYTKQEQTRYLEGYADGILYSNRTTLEIYRK